MHDWAIVNRITPTLVRRWRIFGVRWMFLDPRWWSPLEAPYAGLNNSPIPIGDLLDMRRENEREDRRLVSADSDRRVAFWSGDAEIG